MASYLARHEVDKNGAGWSPGHPEYPSPGRVAWAAWGGDAAVSWTNNVINSAEKSVAEEESYLDSNDDELMSSDEDVAKATELVMEMLAPELDRLRESYALLSTLPKG